MVTTINKLIEYLARPGNRSLRLEIRRERLPILYSVVGQEGLHDSVVECSVPSYLTSMGFPLTGDTKHLEETGEVWVCNVWDALGSENSHKQAFQMVATTLGQLEEGIEGFLRASGTVEL